MRFAYLEDKCHEIEIIVSGAHGRWNSLWVRGGRAKLMNDGTIRFTLELNTRPIKVPGFNNPCTLWHGRRCPSRDVFLLFHDRHRRSWRNCRARDSVTVVKIRMDPMSFSRPDKIVKID